MSLNAHSNSGLPGPLVAEHYVYRMLMDRALSKLDSATADSLLSAARQELARAQRWTDDVRIAVKSRSKITNRGQCIRMLHGVPSPRIWATQAPFFPAMAAKDALYFFAPDPSVRRFHIMEAIPTLGGAAELKDWLTCFTSTKFEKQLVDALIAHPGSPQFQNYANRDPSQHFRQVGLIAAEIDRLAWFTGQRSMTLANSVSVWRP